MTIWVDADSCPVRIREIVSRAAGKRGVVAKFVANRPIPLPETDSVELEIVPPEEDGADSRIVECAKPGDLIITRDIPLAAKLVEGGLRVLNDRGETFTEENVRERLSIRNFMKDLRASGMYESPTGGFGDREVKAFSAAFDRELTRLLKTARRTS